MSDREKSREELIRDLQTLQQEYKLMKGLYEQSSAENVVLKQIKGDLLKSEIRFKHVFEAANFQNLADSIRDGIVIASADGHHIYANGHASQLLGYSPEEMLKTTLKDLADPHAYPVRQQRLLDRIAGRPVPSNYETIIRRKDGTSLYVEVSGTKIQWDGQYCDLVVFRDISDRKKAEDELHRSEQRYRLIFENNFDAFLLTDINGGIISVNPATCKMFGRTADEICQIGRNGIVDTSDPRLKVALEERSRTGRFSGELTCLRQDGSKFPVELSTTIFKDTDGLLRTSILIRDITERQESQKLLKESEANARAMMESTNDVFLLLDKTGIVIDSNEAHANRLNTNRAELLGKNVFDYLPEDIRKKRWALIQKAISTGKPIYAEDFRGGYWNEIAIHPIYVENKISDRVAIFARDITERKKAETILKESELKYRNLVENSLVGVLRSKVNGEVIYVNDTTVRMLEFDSREDLIAAGAIIRYKNPAQRDELVRILKKEGRVERFEANVLTQKGNERTFLYSLILDGDTIEGTLIDITDRKRAERAVIENQQFLKTITAEVQEVIFALDAHGIFTFSEGKGLEKLGLKPGQVVGLSVFDAYKDFPEVLEGLRKALAGNLVKTEGLELGNLKFNTNYQPIFDANGQVTSVVGLSIDVTEAKKAEKALSEHTIRLQALLELNEMNHQPFAEILDFVLEASQKMTGSEFSFVGMVDREETELKVVRWSKGVMEQCKMDTGPLSFRVSETGLLCECIRTRQPVFVNNYIEAHPAKKGIPMGHVPITRMMAVPLTENGRVVSVISIANKPDEYTTDDALGITSLLNKMQEIRRWHEVDEALKLSEEKFRTLANYTHDWEAWITPDEKYRYISPSCERISGHLTEEFFNNPNLVKEIAHPDDLIKVEEHLQTVFHEDHLDHSSYDFRIITKDGNIRWISHSCTPVFGHDGKWLGRRESNRDITDRKQAEEALKESEQRYALATDATEQGIWDWNVEANEVYYSKQWKNQIGYNDHELKNEFATWIEHLHPDEKEACLNVVQEYLENPVGHFLLEFRFRHKDGSYRWIFNKASSMKNADGKVIRMFGTHTDITERKQAEEALLESELKFKAIADTSPLAIYMSAGIEQKAEYINPTFINLFGYEIEEVPSANEWWPIAYPDENYRKQIAEEWQQKVKQAIENQSEIEPMEVVVTCKNGLTKNIVWGFKPIGKQNWTFGLDITERKQAEGALLKANETLQNLNAEKDKFFSILAHDLRSPFNSFLGMTQIMAEELPNLTMSQVQEMAVSMSKSASSLYRLLENLLQWSQVQRGTIQFKQEPVLLRQATDESIEMLKETARNKGIEIVTDILESLWVTADNNMLQTVIRNLISNAVKYSLKGALVTLSAKTTPENWVEVSCCDTGIGMTREIVETLFRIDVKINQKGTDGEPSSGLGLLLCKEFIEKHGGQIWVESEVGKGSTFYFSLPGITEETK